MLVAPQVAPQAQPAPRQSSRGELCLGAAVRIGQRSFRIMAPLGSGSFSSVWSAVSMDGTFGEVAIKETLCRTPLEAKDAENEARILQQVGGSFNRIPEMIAIDTVPISGGTSVRIAMGKVAGESLGAFLNNWKAKGGGAPSNDPRTVANQFSEACNWGRELISQLLPAFEAVAPVALHRDVNTHNLLVKTPAGDLAGPQFGLIDFGLAIEIKDWHNLSTQEPVVGDCRYWPASAWYSFSAGGSELAKQQPLLAEYRTQLDLHALGITALQVFVEMLPQALPGTSPRLVPEEFRALKSAWERYWQDAYRLWEPLFHAFERKTDWTQLREHYMAKRVWATIADDLANVRQALSNVCDACVRAEPCSQLFLARPLFATLMELISQGGTCLPGEVSSGGKSLPTWQSARSALEAPFATAIAAPAMSFRPSMPAQGTSITTALKGTGTSTMASYSHVAVLGTSTSYGTSTSSPVASSMAAPARRPSDPFLFGMSTSPKAAVPFEATAASPLASRHPSKDSSGSRHPSKDSRRMPFGNIDFNGQSVVYVG